MGNHAAVAAVSTLFAFAAGSRKPALEPLFNGKDLTGWKHVGPRNMTVEDASFARTAAWAFSTGPPGKLSNCRIRRGLQDARLQ